MTSTATKDASDRVLRELLALASSRFGAEGLEADQDLFDSLGIDSMEALSLLTALEERFGVEIPDYEVQDVRTFRELAEVVGSRL